MHDDQLHNAVERGHEPSTLSARAVAKGFSALYGVLIFALLLVGGFMFLFSKIDGGNATVDAPAQTTATPSGVPTLDSNQSGSLHALRARERQVLTEYRWVDAETAVARIPIKRAMELLGQSSRFGAQTTDDGAVEP